MKHIVIAFALALPFRLMADDGAWQDLQSGMDAYKRGDLGTAETNFEKATVAAPTEHFDPAVPEYDRANAEFRAGNTADAAEDFDSAVRTPNLRLQSMAYFNRGNVKMKISDGQQQQQKLDDAIKSVDEAMTMYGRSIMLAPKDRDPKVNYELAAKKKSELEKLKKQQQQQQQQNKQDKNNEKNKQDQQQQKNGKQNQSQEKKSEQNKEEQQKQGKQQQKENGGQDQQNQKNNGGEKKPEEMTPQEATAMLQAVKQEEEAQRQQLFELLHKSKNGNLPPVDMDW